MQDAIARGALRIGVAEENFLPWLANDKSGNRMGFEIDIAQSVASALKVDTEFVEMPFDTLLRGLTLGEVDIVISGVSVSADRARQVLFSAPYSSTDFNVVIDKTNLPDGAADKGYDVEGVKIGVAAGTLADYAAASEFQSAELLRYDSNGDLRDAFLAGQVNGVIAPTPYPDFIVSRDPGRYAAEDRPVIATVEAMAVRTDSARFLNFLNSWVMENKASGALEAKHDYWFEELEWLERLEGYQAEKAEDDAGKSDSK